MRVERTGPIVPLTPRFGAFLKQALSGISLDDDGDKERRPDFTCLRGLVAIEVKSLEESPAERLENVVRPEREKDTWPMFYGQMDGNALLNNLPKPDQDRLRHDIAERAARSIRRQIKNGNDQLEAHTRRTGRRALVRLLVIINEDHPEYSPDLIHFAAGRELSRRGDDGLQRSRGVDAIIYLSERHVVPADGVAAIPLFAIHCEPIKKEPWKAEVVNFILHRWAKWNRAAEIFAAEVNPKTFETVEHVPERMPQHELWRLNYRRRPFMSAWSNAQVRDAFDAAMLRNQVHLANNLPFRFDKDESTKSWESFTHILEEMARRGMTMDAIGRLNERRAKAAVERLPYGEDVKNWFRECMSDQDRGQL